MKQRNKENYFRFKRFALFHGFNSFKIGTDAVILGAWSNQKTDPKKILDIGTGSGIIALMMAQRFGAADISAIEIDSESAKIAEKNFRDSPYYNQLNLINEDLKSYHPLYKFDSIVSNPPFFTSGILPINWDTARSKHNISLSLSDIFQFASSFLNSDGLLSIIYPYSQIAYLEKEAAKYEFFMVSFLKIYPKPDHKAQRCIIEFSKTKRETIQIDNLIIENEARHDYHNSYKNLCKDFYLKF